MATIKQGRSSLNFEMLARSQVPKCFPFRSVEIPIILATYPCLVSVVLPIGP